MAETVWPPKTELVLFAEELPVPCGSVPTGRVAQERIKVSRREKAPLPQMVMLFSTRLGLRYS